MSSFKIGDAVGTFEVKSGKLVVTDPCYDRGTWCMGLLEDVKNGTWEAYTQTKNEGFWGDRVAKLVVFHKDHDTDIGATRHIAQFEVGVDSGQAGFFDEPSYPQGDPGEYGDLGTFYGRVCALHDGDKDEYIDAGIVDGSGVVSSSGFGDGGYRCNFYKLDGQVVAAEIVFIGDEDDDDEDDEWDDDEDLEECDECGEEDTLSPEGLCTTCDSLERCEVCQVLYPPEELDDYKCPVCREEDDEDEEEK